MIDAYAAGIIDGEGCLYIDTTLTPVLDVGMSTPAMPLLRSLAEQYGGTISQSRPETDRWAAAYSWTLSGYPMEEHLRAWAPHLIVKREQALMLLELIALKRATIPPSGQRARLSPNDRRRAELLRSAVKSLNRKGPAAAGMDMLSALPADVEPLQPAQMSLVPDLETSCETWFNSGMAWRTGYSTRSISECPSGADACSCSPSLATILEPAQSVPPRYSLSAKAAAGILRRATKRGRTLPPELMAALEAAASGAPQVGVGNLTPTLTVDGIRLRASSVSP